MSFYCVETKKHADDGTANHAEVIDNNLSPIIGLPTAPSQPNVSYRN